MKFSKDIQKFLKEPNYMVLGTHSSEGTIQMSIVWFDYDGRVFRFSTTTERVKYKNLTKDPNCTFLIYGRENPYKYVSVKALVKSHTTRGGHDFIDKLAWKYLKKKKYPYDPERKENRVSFTLTPKSYSQSGFE